MASCGAARVNRIAASFVQSLNNMHLSGLETHGGGRIDQRGEEETNP